MRLVRRNLTAAAGRLLRLKSYKEISVAELAAKAGV